MIGVKQLIELVGWLKKYDHIEIHGLEGSEGWFRFALHIVDPFIRDELEDLKETLSKDGWKFSHTYRDTDDNIHAVFIKEVNLDEYAVLIPHSAVCGIKKFSFLWLTFFQLNGYLDAIERMAKEKVEKGEKIDPQALLDHIRNLKAILWGSSSSREVGEEGG
jgi:hypothetical protein